MTAWIDRIGRGRLPGWLSESLGVSLAAQAATLPVVLLSFGRLAIIAPAVNLAIVPLVAPAMAAGVVALAGGGRRVARRSRGRRGGRRPARLGDATDHRRDRRDDGRRAVRERHAWPRWSRRRLPLASAWPS